jgi:hypothetical protein
MSTTKPFGEPAKNDAGPVDSRPQGDVYTGVISRLLAGPLGIGGLGWALDEWLHTSFLLPCGILLGMALALYVIWLRYGTS